MSVISEVVVLVLFLILICLSDRIWTARLLSSSSDECKWMMINESSDSDVALVCKLRTINSELGYTHFNAIDPQHTTILRLECKDSLAHQSALNPGSFRTLNKLRDLSIDYCKIGLISNQTFHGLVQLESLSIRIHNLDWPSNYLEFESNSFSNLVRLKKLDLSDNSIQSVPSHLLKPLAGSLTVLNLTKNSLETIDQLEFRKCCDKLQLLDLSRNRIREIHSESFANLHNLNKLYLHKNNLEILHTKSFHGLRSLKILRLSDNRLRKLPGNLFADLQIQELYLQNNNLSRLGNGLFNQLRNLLVLDLSQNNLTTDAIRHETFRDLRKLVILDLSENQLNSLEIEMFADLVQLQILKLNNNRLEVLENNQFRTLINLRTLTVSNNMLKQIEPQALSGLIELSLLSLDNNQLRTIEANLFRNLTNLHHLHLNGNSLTALASNMFDYLPLLKTLDLGENFIEQLTNRSFDRLKHLYGLRLADNRLTRIDRGIFTKMFSLKVLNLSKNRLRVIESGALDSNRNLQAIRFDQNQLDNLTGIFSNLNNLFWLNISNNEIQTFRYADIGSSLQWLDMHSNRIELLENDRNSLSNYSLNTFDLSFNRLTRIAPDLLPDSLRVLNLNNNRISKIEPYTFVRKANLTQVLLESNELTTLDINSFRIASSLQEKDQPEFALDRNPFECDCRMEWLKSIYDHRHNHQIRILPIFRDIEMFQCRLAFQQRIDQLPTASSPQLSFLFSEIPSTFFLCEYRTNCERNCSYQMQCPQNCRCFHNQLWTENIIDCSERNGSLVPSNATQLLLDGNYFPILNDFQFVENPLLQHLYLNRSKIETISPRAFANLNELRSLHLQHNNLAILNGSEFEPLTALEYLNLANNRLEFISNRSFQMLSKLKTLSLAGNRFETIEIWTMGLTNNLQLQNLQLQFNPFACNCSFLINFKNWSQYYPNLVPNIDQFECSSNGRNRIKFDNFLLDECRRKNNAADMLSGPIKTVVYDNQDFFYWLLIFLILFSFVIFVILFLFIYRLEIQVLFYEYFDRRLFRSKFDFDDRTKLFDAFVSYSSKDERFVYEQLVRELENDDSMAAATATETATTTNSAAKRSYKLCLHHRDLLSTNTANSIVQAVEASRRTILIVSENFLQSEWCHFEFKSAHHQALRDKRKRLIVILLGSVTNWHKNELDPEIKLYLKTNICLRWREQFFWQKLRYFLPNVARCRHHNHNHNHPTYPHHHHHQHHHLHRHHISHPHHRHLTINSTTSSTTTSSSMNRQTATNNCTGSPTSSSPLTFAPVPLNITNFNVQPLPTTPPLPPTLNPYCPNYHHHLSQLQQQQQQQQQNHPIPHQPQQQQNRPLPQQPHPYSAILSQPLPLPPPPQPSSNMSSPQLPHSQNRTMAVHI